MSENKPIHIELTYESLIAMLQGKEFHITTPDIYVIFHPPFKGVFITHEQLREIEYTAEKRVLNMIEKVMEYKEERKGG